MRVDENPRQEGSGRGSGDEEKAKGGMQSIPFRPASPPPSSSPRSRSLPPPVRSPAMAVPCGPQGSPLVASSVAISSSDSLSANFLTPRTAASRALANAVPSSLRSSFFIHSISSIERRERGKSQQPREIMGKEKREREREREAAAQGKETRRCGTTPQRLKWGRTSLFFLLFFLYLFFSSQREREKERERRN